MNRWFPLSGYIAVLICCLFAFRALLLVDASGLWSDELYSVGKSFESDLRFLSSLMLHVVCYIQSTIGQREPAK